MMKHFNYKHLFLFFLAIVFLLQGCTPKLSTESSYPLKECKEELFNAKDYQEDESIDYILVRKKERKMYLYNQGKIQQVIAISLGKYPLGHKQQQGDYRTPEGTYFIHRKLCSSKYYRSLCISYPNAEDKQKANMRGLNPGGNITIHAQPAWNADGKGDQYTLSQDWTRGCIAVSNDTMKDLWYKIHEGIPITIE